MWISDGKIGCVDFRWRGGEERVYSRAASLTPGVNENPEQISQPSSFAKGLRAACAELHFPVLPVGPERLGPSRRAAVGAMLRGVNAGLS